jgi:AbrB family looped-hinge helix DNA binding protein
MDQVTIDSRYCIAIPKAVRDELGLRPGQRLSVILKGGIIHLVPVPKLKDLRGFARGAKLQGMRDEADRT